MARSNTTGSQTLHFSHRGRSCTVDPGQQFTPESQGDSYRDVPSGEMEAIMARIRAGVPWRDAVGAQLAQANPWLHRIVTDPRRALFFHQHPPQPGARVLDIGAGWGQIALPLAQTAQVCALEPTPERLRFIAAAARQDGLDTRMWFVQADFLEVEFAEPFDLVTCIGVLEWVPKFAPHLAPRDAQRLFLSRARTALRAGGQFVIGIENRLGLKYLLGAPDDHIDAPHIAVYDETLADRKWRERSGQPLRCLTHTRAEYEVLLREAGFGAIRIWSAFPDYKLPEVIVAAGPETDRFLRDGFVPEHDGIRGQPLPFQEELTSHYRSFAALGIASDFAPSFFISAEPGS
jgi:2-polyprenyl-3-methyl-5-hydroxy-6-metoxy-1,4-benzoquinol methylase